MVAIFRIIQKNLCQMNGRGFFEIFDQGPFTLL